VDQIAFAVLQFAKQTGFTLGPLGQDASVDDMCPTVVENVEKRTAIAVISFVDWQL
jgi:hypothetical protein